MLAALGHMTEGDPWRIFSASTDVTCPGVERMMLVFMALGANSIPMLSDTRQAANIRAGLEYPELSAWG